jgi:hypothetical protein
MARKSKWKMIDKGIYDLTVMAYNQGYNDALLGAKRMKFSKRMKEVV